MMSIWLELGLLILLVLFLMGIWAFLQVYLVEPQEPQNRFSFKLKSLLTETELRFYDVLVRAVGGEYLIVPEAHLSDFMESTDTGTEKFAAWAHLGRKSVDFLLCDTHSVRPLLAIELDDASHYRRDRRERDEKVEALFKKVSLPLLRYKALPVVEELREEIHKHIT